MDLGTQDIELVTGLHLLGVLQLHDDLAKSGFPLDKLNELKRVAKKNYRILALAFHPDRTQGDEIKAQKFILATKAIRYVELLRGTKVHVPPVEVPTVEPRPPIPWNRFPPHMRSYLKRRCNASKLGYCYFFCTASTCKHGTYSKQRV